MKIFILLSILLSASFTSDVPARFYTVVWNVGQGQFVSAISPSSCLHFDMGGEFFPWKKIFAQCKDKPNFAFFSHWDWDHIGALNTLKHSNSISKEFCIALRPSGTSSKHKMKLLNSFPSCSPSDNKISLNIWTPKITSKSSSNDGSQVLFNKNVLIPGDSPIQQEKIWSHRPWVKQSRILVLGHHGSQTSTSSELLDSLPNLKLAISSARWRRYHHPHPLVEARLNKERIPLLRTEDWGNIWIEQNME